MNERFFSLPPEKQQAILNAGYRQMAWGDKINNIQAAAAEIANVEIIYL